MQLGLQIVKFDGPKGTYDAAVLTEIVQAAEDAGFSTVALGDHFWQIEPWMGPPSDPLFEAYTTLGFLAGKTESINLMALVTGVHHRQPGLLAKIATTLDVLAEGRTIFGIGAGHYELESRGLGIPYPALGTRFEMLEEAIQICLGMWEGEHGSEQPFDGQHYHLERMLNSPQALQRPHPPIMIAGGGEKKTLRLVAKYADLCSLQPGPAIPHKLDVLRQHCETEGRDYDGIRKTCSWLFKVGEHGEDSEQLVEQLRGMCSMGIQDVYGRIEHPDPVAAMEIIKRDVFPAIRDLEPPA